jgi:DNA-binding XRE family transcriptional regulator
MTFNKQQFSEDLFMLRNTKGLSRAAAAKEIGIPPATVQGMEDGLRCPRTENYFKCCEWMGKDMKYYFKNN